VTQTPPPLPQPSRKRILPAFLLCVVFSAHRLYAGKIWTGLVQIAWLAGAYYWFERESAGMLAILRTGGYNLETFREIAEWQQIHGTPFAPMLAMIGAGIWVAIDASRLVARKFTDSRGNKITRWI